MVGARRPDDRVGHVVGARLGFKAITAAGHYVIAFALLMIGVMALVYMVAVVVGRAPFRKFASAVGLA
jgi:Na+/H+-dicarboxylate symporter